MMDLMFLFFNSDFTFNVFVFFAELHHSIKNKQTSAVNKAADLSFMATIRDNDFQDNMFLSVQDFPGLSRTGPSVSSCVALRLFAVFLSVSPSCPELFSPSLLHFGFL